MADTTQKRDFYTDMAQAWRQNAMPPASGATPTWLESQQNQAEQASRNVILSTDTIYRAGINLASTPYLINDALGWAGKRLNIIDENTHLTGFNDVHKNLTNAYEGYLGWGWNKDQAAVQETLKPRNAEEQALVNAGTVISETAAGFVAMPAKTLRGAQIVVQETPQMISSFSKLKNFLGFGRRGADEVAEASAKSAQPSIAATVTKEAEDAGDALRRLVHEGAEDVAPKAAGNVTEEAAKLSGRALQREANTIAKEIRGAWYSPNRIRDKGTVAAATRDALKNVAENPNDIYRASDKAARVAIDGGLGWRAGASTAGLTGGVLAGTAKFSLRHPFLTAATAATADGYFNSFNATQAMWSKATDFLTTGSLNENVNQAFESVTNNGLAKTITDNPITNSSLFQAIASPANYAGNFAGGMAKAFGNAAENLGIPAELAGAVAVFTVAKMLLGGNLLPAIAAAAVTYLAPNLFKPEQDVPAPSSESERKQFFENLTTGPSLSPAGM